MIVDFSQFSAFEIVGGVFLMIVLAVILYLLSIFFVKIANRIDKSLNRFFKLVK